MTPSRMVILAKGVTSSMLLPIRTNTIVLINSRNHTKSISTTNSGSRSFLNQIFKIQSLEEFEEKVKNSKTPVIVDFFATWCAPCKMLTPRIESIVGENAGKITLFKVDIDEHNELAFDYDVASVPVLLSIRNGKVEHRLVGLQDTDKLRQWVDNIMKQT